MCYLFRGPIAVLFIYFIQVPVPVHDLFVRMHKINFYWFIFKQTDWLISIKYLEAHILFLR